MESHETNSTEDSSPRKEVQKETPWKLVVFCIVFILIFFVFVFYPPAKQMLFETQHYLQSQGWYGSLGLCLFASFIIVPFGIPYSMVQMMFAIMIPQYWLALLLTSVSQTFGSTIAYGFMKYVFRKRLTAWARKQTIFRGIDLILTRHPFRFSVILNLTNLPLIIKNYALAMPESVGFKIFTLSSIIGAVFTSAPQIYLFQQAENLDNILDHTKTTLGKIITVLSTVLSVAIIVYFAWYTKKVLNDVHKEIKALEPMELKGRQAADGDVKIDVKHQILVEENVDIKPQHQILVEEKCDKVKSEGVMIGGINPIEASSNQEVACL